MEISVGELASVLRLLKLAASEAIDREDRAEARKLANKLEMKKVEIDMEEK